MTMPAGHRFISKVLPLEHDYLAPDQSEIRLLSEMQEGGLAHCTLPAGATSKPVSHKIVVELWFFLSGNGEVWRKLGDSEEITQVSSGVSLAIPTGASFQFGNLGKDPLCFVIVTIPKWPGPDEAIPVEGKWDV